MQGLPCQHLIGPPGNILSLYDAKTTSPGCCRVSHSLRVYFFFTYNINHIYIYITRDVISPKGNRRWPPISFFWPGFRSFTPGIYFQYTPEMDFAGGMQSLVHYIDPVLEYLACLLTGCPDQNLSFESFVLDYPRRGGTTHTTHGQSRLGRWDSKSVEPMPWDRTDDICDSSCHLCHPNCVPKYRLFLCPAI